MPTPVPPERDDDAPTWSWNPTTSRYETTSPGAAVSPPAGSRGPRHAAPEPPTSPYAIPYPSPSPDTVPGFVRYDRWRSSAETDPAATPAPRRPGRPYLVIALVGVVVAVVALIIHLMSPGIARPSQANALTVGGASATAGAPSAPLTSAPNPATAPPSVGAGAGPVLAPPTPTTAPFLTGSCLAGTIPDSSVAVPVDDVTPTSCASANAHYQVIQVFSGTTDMDLCQTNARTQFEYSQEDTVNGLPVDEYVYCLVGLGSYAR